MTRTKFGEIARTRQLDYCPTCAPERARLENMLSVLSMRNRAWFTCACGAQWWTKRKTGEIKERHILEHLHPLPASPEGSKETQ